MTAETLPEQNPKPGRRFVPNTSERSSDPWASLWSQRALKSPIDLPERVVTAWLDHGAILGTGTRYLIGIGARKEKSEPSPVPAKAAFYSPDFFAAEPRPWLEHETDLWLTRDELLRSLATFLSPSLMPRLTWVPPDRDDFVASFEDLQARIRDGILTKAVPVVFETARFRPERVHRAQWLHRALQYAEKLPVSVYGSWDADAGMMGATPETLFEYDHGRVATMALAGTRRDADRESLGTLLADPKELREHAIVVEGISKALSGWGDLHVGETEEMDLPGLSHLRTPIALTPSRAPDFARMALALHPTPALGAVPREEGWEWLRAQDRGAAIKRGRFGAPFGVRADGYGRCVVAIRGLQWVGDELMLGAGAGVIAESKVEREWAELQGKIRAIQGIFGFL